jgi:ADP-ribose pyrophosphatase YjhB (NUDIX family)
MTKQDIVRALIRDKEKVFLVQRNEKQGYNQWQLPGGHTDGQSYKSALARELKEETNLNMKTAKIKRMFLNPITNKRTVVYDTRIKSPGNIKLQQSEIKASGWFTKNQIKKMNVTPSTRRVLR